MAENKVVGQSIRRLDAYEKVTGTARYTIDHTEPGTLYVKVLRSPYPHAKIVSIHSEKAQALYGVEAIMTCFNCPQTRFNWSDATVCSPTPEEVALDMCLFDQEVRYVGDEVAAVAAISEEIARKALQLIDVEYELLPAIMDVHTAMEKEAPLLHPEVNPVSNQLGCVHKVVGDIQKGFAACDVIIEDTYCLPVAKQMQLETQNALAVFSGDGKLTVWSPTQSPALAQRLISNICNIPMSKIRVRNPGYVGGAFGVRIGLSSKAELMAVEFARRTGRPVKFVYDRREDCIASETRHSGEFHVKIGADSEGRILALQAKGMMNTGAYALSSQGMPACASSHILTEYHIPNMDYWAATIYTNYTPAGAMRGYAAPQPTFALELSISKLAEKLNMDPRVLRAKNLMQPGDAWINPYALRTTAAKECIIQGAKKIGWDEFYKENKPQTGRYRRGIGMACGNHISSGAPFSIEHSNVIMAMHCDGSIQFAVGIMEMGTGLKTTLIQIAAEELGASVDTFSLTIGDTEIPLADFGAQASRGTFTTGMAVKKAAANLKQQMLAYAENKKQVAAGSFQLKGTCVCDQKGNIIYSFRQLATDADQDNKQFIAVGQNINDNALSWNAHYADVTVDMETGYVFVNRYVAMHDAGKVINPDLLKSQVEGGVGIGIGYALQEQIAYGQDGKQIHESFHKYMIPVADDLGQIYAGFVETDEPTGPFGAKGVAESPVSPVAPAIADAIHSATGIWFNQLPITPDRVLRQIQKEGLYKNV